MSVTFLLVPYRERESVKALGARWDPGARQWYVPPGRSLDAFSAWLPAAQTAQIAVTTVRGGTTLAIQSGIPLSQLLAGVAAAVASAHRSGVWTMVDVVQVTMNRGHVYLEVAERDADGVVVAKARAMIWARTAETILPAFQKATGVTLGPGIKLLVRARPEVHAQHGFGLEIDALDPDYTLGDLEARKREIRTRLQREGLFDRNRRLPAPWDFNAVLVVAPPDAAGLGDFRAEARRLADARVCEFVYASSRFQGDGAAGEIVAALTKALRAGSPGFGEEGRQVGQGGPGEGFDAIAIIRGGGAANDLAWLNDYALARLVCLAEVPVFTGIGHERDSTVLDEVAHTAFDTPSKVIAGIEQVIRARAADSRALFESITGRAAQQLARARTTVARDQATVESGALRQVASARSQAQRQMGEIRHDAFQTVRQASDRAQERMRGVSTDGTRQLAQARQTAPVLLERVRGQAFGALATARSNATSEFRTVVERARQDSVRSTEQAVFAMAATVDGAKASIARAKSSAEALVREVTGQGADKTLARGFALVRDVNGATITSAASASTSAALRVQFRDGSVDVRLDPDTHKPGEPG